MQVSGVDIDQSDSERQCRAFLTIHPVAKLSASTPILIILSNAQIKHAPSH